MYNKDKTVITKLCEFLINTFKRDRMPWDLLSK